MSAIPQGKIPFWATREFRLMVIVMVMALATVAVFTFEIAPKLRKKEIERVKPVNTSGRPLFVPAAPGAAREVRFDGVLDKVADGTPIAESGEPYARVLRYLTTVNNETLAAESVHINDYPQFAKHSAELRGKSLRVISLYLKTESTRPEPRLPGVDFVHRSYLVDLSGEEGYVVDTLEPPGDLPYRSAVVTDAVFLKMGTFEPAKGPEVRTAPFLAGRSLSPWKENLSKDGNPLGTMTVAVSLLAVVLVMYLSMRMLNRTRPGRIAGTPVSR